MIRSKVKGTSIKLSIAEFRELFQILEDGPETTPHSDAFVHYERFTFYKSLCKPDLVDKIQNSKVFKTGPLKAEDRLLHYLITYLIAPRGCNHAIVMDSDLLHMFAIKNRVQLNWGRVITQHMKHSRNLQYLPFGFHISYLLTIAGVDVKNETAIPPRTIALIDRTSLGKLDLGWNQQLGTFDYLSDHTVKIRRPPRKSSASASSRQRSQEPSSLSERVDTLTRTVNERFDRLEALLLSLFSSRQASPRPAPTMDEPAPVQAKSPPLEAEHHPHTDDEGTETLVIETEAEAEGEGLAQTDPNSDSSTDSDDQYELVKSGSRLSDVPFLNPSASTSTQPEATTAPEQPTEADKMISDVLTSLGHISPQKPTASDLD